MTETKPKIHPGWVRVAHWLNAIAVLIMVTSGWQIYNANPFLHFSFSPNVTLGGWLAGGIQWHFAAMWLLVINGLVYLLLNFVSGRAKGKFLPIRGREIITDLWQALTLRLRHQDLSHYNAIQKIAYLFVWVDIFVLVLSGLVLWKSVQFPILRDLLGSYEIARRVHFAAMALLVGFTLVHLIMVAIVPKSFLTMIRGR